MLRSLVFSLRMVFVTSRHRARMLSGALGTLLACAQIESKTNGFALRSSGVMASQGLGNGLSLFTLVVSLRVTLGNFLRWLATFGVLGIWSLLVLVRLVCRATPIACWRRQHKVCHRHISFQSFYGGVQWLPRCNRRLQ